MCWVNSVPDSQMRNALVATWEKIYKEAEEISRGLLKLHIFNQNSQKTKSTLG